MSDRPRASSLTCRDGGGDHLLLLVQRGDRLNVVDGAIIPGMGVCMRVCMRCRAKRTEDGWGSRNGAERQGLDASFTLVTYSLADRLGRSHGAALEEAVVRLSLGVVQERAQVGHGGGERGEGRGGQRCQASSHHEAPHIDIRRQGGRRAPGWGGSPGARERNGCMTRRARNKGLRGPRLAPASARIVTHAVQLVPMVPGLHISRR